MIGQRSSGTQLPFPLRSLSSLSLSRSISSFNPFSAEATAGIPSGMKQKFRVTRSLESRVIIVAITDAADKPIRQSMGNKLWRCLMTDN